MNRTSCPPYKLLSAAASTCCWSEISPDDRPMVRQVFVGAAVAVFWVHADLDLPWPLAIIYAALPATLESHSAISSIGRSRSLHDSQVTSTPFAVVNHVRANPSGPPPPQTEPATIRRVLFPLLEPHMTWNTPDFFTCQLK